MKTIEIVGENYCGNCDKTRTACRGIVIDGDRILLSYEAKTNQWMIPGGGLESNESDEECCIREIAEETGIVVETVFYLQSNRHNGNKTDRKRNTSWYGTKVA